MRTLSMKGKALVASAAVVGLAGSGVAYAYWTTTGSGSGSATTGSTVGVTVNQSITALSNLYPGGPAEALSGTFTNNNPGAVKIAGVTATVTSVTGGPADGAKPACVAGDFAISGVTTAYTVAPGAVTTWSGLSISLRDTAFNQDNCKGATAGVTYAAAAATP